MWGRGEKSAQGRRKSQEDEARAIKEVKDRMQRNLRLLLETMEAHPSSKMERPGTKRSIPSRSGVVIEDHSPSLVTEATLLPSRKIVSSSDQVTPRKCAVNLKPRARDCSHREPGTARRVCFECSPETPIQIQVATDRKQCTESKPVTITLFHDTRKTSKDEEDDEPAMRLIGVLPEDVGVESGSCTTPALSKSDEDGSN